MALRVGGADKFTVGNTGNTDIAGDLDVTGDQTKYGEMYMYGSAGTATIQIINQYYAAFGVFSEGTVNGFTMVAGEGGAISATSTAVGGWVAMTSAGHTLSAGDYVCINGTATYNGNELVDSVDGNDFYITATNSEADEGGADSDFQSGDYLLASAGTAGNFLLNNSMTISSAAAAKEYKFECVKNATDLGKGAFNITPAGTNHASGSNTSIVTIVAGDRIWMKFKNETDAQDLEYQHANITLHKL
jgi:hypothetical protein